MRRHIHDYTKEFGGTQRRLVYLYLNLGKSIDEIQELIKAPRPSIRRCKQEWNRL